jgi:hypothetical protein
MGDHPLIAGILAIACVMAGLAGIAYFTQFEENYPLAAVGAGGILIGVGLWRHWRWSWWVGFALLTGLLVWNWMHRPEVTILQWYISALLWVYFAAVFREYN